MQRLVLIVILVAMLSLNSEKKKQHNSSICSYQIFPCSSLFIISFHNNFIICFLWQFFFINNNLLWSNFTWVQLHTYRSHSTTNIALVPPSSPQTWLSHFQVYWFWFMANMSFSGLSVWVQVWGYPMELSRLSSGCRIPCHCICP